MFKKRGQRLKSDFPGGEKSVVTTVLVLLHTLRHRCEASPDRCPSAVSNNGRNILQLTVWLYQAEQTAAYLVQPLFSVNEVKQTFAAQSLSLSSFKFQTTNLSGLLLLIKELCFGLCSYLKC